MKFKRQTVIRNILLLFLTVETAGLWGQQTREFSVYFDSNCWFFSSAKSEKFEVEVDPEADFTGLSAYVMDPAAEVELHYRIKSGKEWSEWQAFRQNTHGETPDRTAFEAEPVQDVFSEIQFKASDTLDEPVIFRLYFPTTEKKSPEVSRNSKSADTCACPQPPYCDRSCWCPDNSCDKPYTPVPTQSTHIIVHHSAGFNSSNDYKAVVAYYWDLHVNTNGWDDIGYNWLIDPNGEVYEARGSGITGAHFSCMNSQTTGICLIGNFENQNPTVLAKNALKDLIAWEACDKNILVEDSSLHSSSQLLLKHVSGHRDGNPSTIGCPSGTVCPGSFLYAQLPDITSDVAANSCYQGVGIEKISLRKNSMFPNPFKDVLYLQWEDSRPRQLEIFSLSGKKLNTFSTTARKTELNLSSLARGTYLLKVTGADGVYTQSIVKQ